MVLQSYGVSHIGQCNMIRYELTMFGSATMHQVYVAACRTVNISHIFTYVSS